jgi:hypothetical protein
MAPRAAALSDFYSLAEVNAAIAELLTHLNEERPIRRLGATRRQLLDDIDRPALKALPIEPYEFSEWRTCRVGHRLSRRDRRPLLLAPSPLPAGRSRRAADRQNGRNLLEGRAHRRACAHERQSQAHDASRAYALQPSVEAERLGRYPPTTPGSRKMCSSSLHPLERTQPGLPAGISEIDPAGGGTFRFTPSYRRSSSSGGQAKRKSR